MRKMFGFKDDCKSVEEKTRAVLTKCEDCMDLSFKASGTTIMEAMENLDAGTGAMIGSCMELYKESKELAIMQAKVMDKLLEEIENVKDMNEELCEQNKNLQRMLQDLDRKIEKIGK